VGDGVESGSGDAKRGGGTALQGVSDGESLAGLLVMLVVFLLVYAVVYALIDVFGRWKGSAIAVTAGAATVVVLGMLAPDAHAAGVQNLVRGFGVWPTAVIGSFLVWSAMGIPPAAYYVVRWHRTRPRTASTS